MKHLFFLFTFFTTSICLAQTKKAGKPKAPSSKKTTKSITESINIEDYLYLSFQYYLEDEDPLKAAKSELELNVTTGINDIIETNECNSIRLIPKNAVRQNKLNGLLHTQNNKPDIENINQEPQYGYSIQLGFVVEIPATNENEAVYQISFRTADIVTREFRKDFASAMGKDHAIKVIIDYFDKNIKTIEAANLSGKKALMNLDKQANGEQKEEYKSIPMPLYDELYKQQIKENIADAKLSGRISELDENATEQQMEIQDAQIQEFNSQSPAEKAKTIKAKAKTISEPEFKKAEETIKANTELYIQNASYNLGATYENFEMEQDLPITDPRHFKTNNTKKYAIKSGTIYFINQETVNKLEGGGTSPVIGEMSIDVSYDNKTELSYKFIDINYAKVSATKKDNNTSSFVLGTGNEGKPVDYAYASFNGDLAGGIKVDKNGNYIVILQTPYAIVKGKQTLLQVLTGEKGPTNDEEYGYGPITIDLEMMGKLKEGQLKISGKNEVKLPAEAAQFNLSKTHYIQWDLELIEIIPKKIDYRKI